VPEPHLKPVYAYQDWEIDLTRQEIRWRGAAVPIGSRAFEIIEVLVEAAGDTINKYDLMDRVWPGAVVEENTLQFHISAVRKALGRDRGMLKSVFGRGYRLLGKCCRQTAAGFSVRLPDGHADRARRGWQNHAGA
jgi:DNA-binding winged helix-turn-helix (wHTH) protein